MAEKMRSDRAAVVVFSHYPADPRVRRETEALQQLELSIDLFCLQGPQEPAFERQGSVAIHRLPIAKQRSGKLRYLFQYGAFALLAGLKLTLRHLERPYGLVHVHNMPDFLVFAALAPRLTGAKIMLDLHDPTPEVFMTKFGVPAHHRAIRLLRAVERLSTGFAHVVLTPNKAFKELFAARSAPARKIHIVMNSPQEELFRPCEETPAPGDVPEVGFRVMFHGTVVERHGLDTVLHALRLLRPKIPSLAFDVYGGGDFVDTFKRLVGELNLQDIVTYHGQVPLEQIPVAIRRCSVGVIPNRRTPFTELNLPTRIFEYLCLGKPVVVPHTKGILDYFTEQELFFFEPGDAASLSEALWRVYADPAARHSIVQRGRAVYLRYTWEKERTRFQELVRRLLGGKSGQRKRSAAEDALGPGAPRDTVSAVS